MRMAPASPPDTPVAKVSASLSDLVPRYLARLKDEVAKAEAALPVAGYPVIESVGHKMAGSGGGYGFPDVTRFGRALEEAARRKDREGVLAQLRPLAQYLETVRVEFVEDGPREG